MTRCNDLYRVSRFLLMRLLSELAGGVAWGEKIPADFSGVFEVVLPHYDQRFHQDGNPVPGGLWTVTVNPSHDPANGHKSSKHRVMITCRCGQSVPYGRLHQHMPACLKNYGTTGDHATRSDDAKGNRRIK